jgi:ribosomal protein L35
MTKTKKTLIKRVKITKGGKILKKQNQTGHLNRKNDANKGHRKDRIEEVTAKGYRKKIKRMLAKHGRKVGK